MREKLYAEHVAAITSRYDTVLATHGYDAAVIYSGGLRIQFLDDAPYPFKTNPLFKAWVPLTEHPECFIVYSPGNKPRLVYFQPDDYWHKPPDSPSGYWTSSFDIEIATDKDAVQQFVPQGNVALFGEWQERFEGWGIACANPTDALNHLHFLRAWKTPYEIGCMEAASRVGVLGHLAAARAFEEGKSEYEIHLDYMSACQLTEEQLPYSNIVALNSHGAVLHYTYRDTVAPKTRHSFLIDAGGSYAGYASDITRTYSANNDDFAALVDGMDKLQQQLCKGLAPGVSYVDAHIRSHEYIAGLMIESGLASGSADEVVGSGLSGRFFPHGLGHYIGLQVHDVGGFMHDETGRHVAAPEAHKFLRLTREIDTGQVMTVEPGLYFIPTLLEPVRDTPAGRRINWAMVDALYPCGGIRIEDNVLITENGSRNLTREAFAGAVDR